MSEVDDLPDVLFHGTNSLHRESLENGIDVNEGNENTDFWKGFYVTSFYEQALDWANKSKIAGDTLQKARLPRNQWRTVAPLVLAYKLDKETLKNFIGQLFPLTPVSATWGCFVYNNRIGDNIPSTHQSSSGFQVCHEHNRDFRFKYVYGPLADKKLDQWLYKLQMKKITFETFLSSAKVFRADQLSLHSNECAKSLTAIGEVKNNAEAKKIISQFSHTHESRTDEV